MSELSPDVQMLVEQGERYKTKLNNGEKGDLHAMSDGIVYLIDANLYQLRSRYVPDDVCDSRMTTCAEKMKRRGDWPRAVAVIGSTAAILLTFLRLLGKI